MGFDWKIGIFILQFVSIAVSLITFFVIKFNDFRHLEKYVNEIKKDQKEMNNSINDLNVKVAKIQGEIQ